MPRNRKDPLASILQPLAARFAAEVSAAVMGYVQQRVRDEVESVVARAVGTARPAAARPLGRSQRVAAAAAPRRIRVCRVPGCGRPSKGPRYDFFCEVHRELPPEQKAAVKAGKPLPGAPASAGVAEAAKTGKAPVRRAKKTRARPKKRKG